MITARVGVLLALNSASWVAFAVPTLLVVQLRQPSKDKNDLNVEIAEYIAQELDTNGRVSPINYSMTDPLFKAAITTGPLKGESEFPKGREIFSVERKLRAEYMLVIESSHAGKLIKAKAQLFRDRRAIWKDEESMSITSKDTQDSESTGRSIARTFVIRMNAGPLKSLPERPKTTTPKMQPGQGPNVAPISTSPTGDVSNAQLKANVEKLVQAKQMMAAVLLIKDAIDAAPFDVDRRLLLVNLLQSSDPRAAAEAARQAANLMPDRVELHIIAARAWIKSGNPEEAQKDLNEAIARDPNGAGTRLLLGELSLQQLEPAKAIAHIDEAIKLQDSAQARFLRATCRALLGGTDGMQKDLAQIEKFEPTRQPEEIARRYSFAVEITDRALTKDGAELRSLIPKIIVKRTDKDLLDQDEELLRLIQSRTAFLSAIPVPLSGTQANNQRLLAQKLMIQAALDIQSYSMTGDEDILVESRINIGEALKQLVAAKTAQ